MICKIASFESTNAELKKLHDCMYVNPTNLWIIIYKFFSLYSPNFGDYRNLGCRSIILKEPYAIHESHSTNFGL